MENYICVNKISKVINKKTVLDEISINFEKGKIYGLTGHNGSGKTMFLRALSGLIKLTSGEIIINEKKLKFNEDLPENIGIMIENSNLIPYYSGFENLRYLADMKSEISDEKILDLMKMMDIYDEKDIKMKKYSLGMKQKIAVIQAIMEEQKLILLDEPTNALDKKSVKKFKEIILKLKKEGKTIIIVSHQESVINDIADIILEFEFGKLIDVREV